MLEYLSPLIALAGAGGLLLFAGTRLKPVRYMNEGASSAQRRFYWHEWAMHGAFGLTFCSGLILLAPVISPDAPPFGGAMLGLLIAPLAAFFTPPPMVEDGRGIASHPIISSAALHSMIAATLAMLQPS